MTQCYYITPSSLNYLKALVGSVQSMLQVLETGSLCDIPTSPKPSGRSSTVIDDMAHYVEPSTGDLISRPVEDILHENEYLRKRIRDLLDRYEGDRFE